MNIYTRLVKAPMHFFLIGNRGCHVTSENCCLLGDKYLCTFHYNIIYLHCDKNRTTLLNYLKNWNNIKIGQNKLSMHTSLCYISKN